MRSEEKKFGEAATAFSTALSLDPLDEEAAAGLAAALSEQGKLAEAEAALARSIESNAKSPVLWNNLGVVRIERGSYASGIQAFEKALALDGSFEAARSNLTRAAELAALERASS